MVNTAGLLGLAVGSLLSGFVAERVGIRPVVLGGIIAAGAGWMVASRTSGLGQLYLVSFLIGMFGGGATVGPIMTLVGNWFVRGAGLALGIAAAGQATGQGVMPFTGATLCWHRASRRWSSFCRSRS